MKKALLALATVATLAASSLATTTPADARCRGCGVGLGVLGGVVLGTAIANSYGPRYAPAPGYVVYDGYGAACSGRLPRRLLGASSDRVRCLRQPGPLEPRALHLPLMNS